MLFQLLSARMPLDQMVAVLVATAIALVLGITVHEFSHAAMATWLGDSTPRYQGRLSLSPVAHLEVMGSLMFLIGGFGWGKPVQINPYALRTNPRTGRALVALAGPLSNLILALILAVPVRLLLLPDVAAGGLGDILLALLFYILRLQLVLAIFNLIPVPPLDGFSILSGILPEEMAYSFERIEQYGFLPLIVLFLLMMYVPAVGSILNGPVELLSRLLTGT